MTITITVITPMNGLRNKTKLSVVITDCDIICGYVIREYYYLPFCNIQIQYSLANPNRGVPISEFVWISEVTLFLLRTNNTKLCDNPIC